MREDLVAPTRNPCKRRGYVGGVRDELPLGAAHKGLRLNLLLTVVPLSKLLLGHVPFLLTLHLAGKHLAHHSLLVKEVALLLLLMVARSCRA